MRHSLAVVLVAAANLVSTCNPATGAAPDGKAVPVVVLDTTGFWRMHNYLAPPVVDADGGPAPVLLKATWLDEPTSPSPPGWRWSSTTVAG